MKKILLALFLFLSACSPTAVKDTDTFQGEGIGKQGSIVVDVVVKNNKIEHIELVKHSEVPGFSGKMIQLADEIISKNSIDVDIIAGATLTSQGFIDAVKDALAKAEVTQDDLMNANKQEQQHKIIEQHSDLVIVGSGGAGFVAAIQAKMLGFEKVTILEKMAFNGGNTRMSGGEYACYNNWVQVNERITDSKEAFIEDVLISGQGRSNEVLVRTLADNLLDNAYWLRDEVGVKYKDEQSWYGGHRVARTLWPVGDGPAYVNTLASKAEELGVEVFYNTKAVEIIMEDDKAIGIKATSDGNTLHFYGDSGVILATGGFSANVDMRQQYNTQWPSLDASIPTTNSPAIVGDGILMAQQVGANLVDMDAIQLYPINNPATGNYYFVDYARLIGNALLVNKEGKRFVDEKETREIISQAAIKQKDAMIYEIIDDQVAKTMNLEEDYASEIARCLDQKVLIKGSLKECAEFFDIPYDTLVETIDRYNIMVEQGTDTDFNRTDLIPIGEGPYLMFSCIVSVHHTMGGVEIDEFAHVLDTEGHIIPNLYAAGEVTGGIHGGNRLGSLSIPDTVCFGRIAAKTAYNEHN